MSAPKPHFTNEELSRILSAHAGGQLKRYGADWGADNPIAGCVIQVSKMVNNDFNLDAEPIASWFDTSYYPSWTPTYLLRRIEKRGRA